jgi:hypothetical protein
VHGSDEGGQLVLGHVLEFVDEDHQGRACRLGRCAGALQQFLQVVFQVAVVGQAWLSFEVKADLDVAVGDLQALGETRQGAQAAHRQVLGMRQLAQAQQRHAQLRSQQGRQRAILGGFDPDGVHA